MAQVDQRLTFFPKRKVRAYLKGWVPKNNAEGEKRIRLDFEIPMLDEARDGMIPGWLINELNAMEAEGSKGKDSDFDTTLEGVTLDFFDTPSSPVRTLLLTAATLDGFFLTRTTRDGKTFIALSFNSNVKRDKATLLWADKYEKCYLWMEATISSPNMPSKPVPGEQMTIADAGAMKDAPDTEDEDESDAEEEVAEQSEQNIREFFGKGESEGSETTVSLKYTDEEGNEHSTDPLPVGEFVERCNEVADAIPVQSPEAAAAVAELPPGHEECSHCHIAFPRAQEPANWIDGKVRKATKAPLTVRRQLGTSFGYICGACVNVLTPKVAEQDDQHEATGMVN